MSIQSQASKPKILIVDDTPGNLTVLTRILSGQGYQVWQASTGQEALKTVQSTHPDLILLDIMMPGIDGYEVCRQLQTNQDTQEIPVIFISALDKMEDKVNAFQVGGVDYINRPFQAEEILTRVKLHLDFRNLQKDLREKNAQLHQELTDLRQTKETLQQRNRQLSLLNKVGQMFSSSLELEHVLETVLGEIRQLLGVVSTAFWLVVPETGELVCKQATGPGSENLINWRLAPGQGVTGWVAQQGESLVVPDTWSDDRHFKTADRQTGLTVRSMVAVPLRVKGTVIGVLNLVDPRAGHFTNNDLIFLEPIAAAAASAIENARLYTMAQQELNERKQAEKSLVEERNLLRTLIDSSPEFIYVKDLENRFLLANQAILNFMGLTSLSELVGKTAFDVQPVDLVVQSDKAECLVIESGQSLINQEEMIVDQQTGATRWWLSSKVPFRDSQGRIAGLVGLNRDITELKQTEKILRGQAILLRGVAGAMTRLLVSAEFELSITETLELLGFATGVDRIYIFETHEDPETGEPLMSQRFTWAQNLFEVQLNTPDFQNLPYKNGFSRWYDLLRAHKIVSGLVQEFPPSECARLKPQGIISILLVPITIRQHFWGFIGFDNCQTERQWSEEEESILLAMAGSIGGAIARQQAERELIAANNELTATLEYLQRTQTHLIESEKMAALGQLVANVAHEINTPLGAIRSSIENISTTLEQTLQQLPAFFQSLSAERQHDFFKLLQRALRKDVRLSTREARKLRHLLAKKLRESHLGHAPAVAETLVEIGIYDDLQPLLPLLNDPRHPEILNMVYRLSGIYESAHTITIAVNRASKVVFALKTYARYDRSGEMIPANISEGLETVLTLYQNQLKHGVDVIRQYEELPPVLCYPDELNQVWINLIQNAIQAMKNKGTLTLAVRPSLIPSPNGEGQGGVMVSITDTGPGIPEALQGKIFEPFFTTKPAGEGSGLGLDIVRKIIDKHQGEINVESQPGRTTFRVLLPLKRDA